MLNNTQNLDTYLLTNFITHDTNNKTDIGLGCIVLYIYRAIT